MLLFGAYGERPIILSTFDLVTLLLVVNKLSVNGIERLDAVMDDVLGRFDDDKVN